MEKERNKAIRNAVQNAVEAMICMHEDEVCHHSLYAIFCLIGEAIALIIVAAYTKNFGMVFSLLIQAVFLHTGSVFYRRGDYIESGMCMFWFVISQIWFMDNLTFYIFGAVIFILEMANACFALSTLREYKRLEQIKAGGDKLIKRIQDIEFGNERMFEFTITANDVITIEFPEGTKF
ncbi:MAG: hypothetical protein LUE86_10215 [Clostridiales bacterium]|nr:hypothetical protein [Clostridiales bacterium]